MKKLTVRSCLICIFLLISFAVQSKAPFHTADSLFHSGKWKKAVLEYLYLLHNNDSAAVKNLAAYKASLIFKYRRNYEKAYNILQNHINEVNTDSLKTRVYYQKALCQYLMGNYDHSLYEVEKARFFVEDPSVHHDLVFLEILIHNELQNWSKARKRFKDLAGDQADTTILSLYKQDSLPDIKNPAKAAKLSTIFPGTGQFYSKNYLKGIESFFFNVLPLGYGVWSYATGFYITGTITGGGLFLKFYTGGIRNARHLCKKYNEEKVEEFNKKVRSKLIKKSF